MNKSEHPRATVIQREMPLLAGLPAPRDASEKTLRLCESEQDAIAVAIRLSRCTQAEIARRMGISRGYLTMLKTGERVLTSDMAARFAIATGSRLVRQYRDLHMALRIARGAERHADRIASIALHTALEAA